MNKKGVQKLFLLIAILFFALNQTGCIERKLIIKSEPLGADVYFNETHMGKTPLDFDFEWYWTHTVKLEKEGYKTMENEEFIKAPSYMWIPCDLIVELLPFKVRDHRALTYNLEPLENKEDEEDKDDVTVEKIDFNN